MRIGAPDTERCSRIWCGRPVNGRHYKRTAESWLRNMDEKRAEIDPLLRETYGDQEALRAKP